MTASATPSRVKVILPRSLSAAAVDAVEAPADVPDVPMRAAWEGTIVVEGIPTGDGRMMELGSLRWADLPIPLRWARQDEGQHLGAVVVGRITEIWREGREVKGRGNFDLGSEEGRDAYRVVKGDDDGPISNGVSVDLDDVDLEVRVAADLLARMDEELEAIMEGETPEHPEPDADGRVVVVEMDADDELLVTTDARIRAATIVDIPAFVEARITAYGFPGEFAFDDVDACMAAGAGDEAYCAAWQRGTEGQDKTLVAAGGPPAPPQAWFADPGLSAPTPLTVTKAGRVYGHLATWGSCHTAYEGCVSPPKSPSGYAYFRTGLLTTAEGVDVPVGRLTADTLHAGRQASPADTLAHYEHTGLAVADCAAGEDRYGIWVAGAIRPGVTDEALAVLKASPLSGDWRRIGGALELVAALAVNSPGFPIPRAMVASGHVTALQAAGAVHRDPAPADLTDDDREILRRMAGRERQSIRHRKDQADRARSRVLVASAAGRVYRT